MIILLISSAGGHLIELIQLEPVFSKFKYVYVTADRENTKAIADYYVKDPGTKKLNYIKLLFSYLLIILKENPNVIITTGAGIALPMILLAKLFRKKVVFIESFCRPFKLSDTGDIVYKYNLANLFLVQWPELVKKYPKTKYWGRVI